MSRFLGIALVVMLIFSLAPVTFAAEVTAAGDTKITLGGELRVRGWYLDNYSANRRTGAGTPIDGSSQAWYDERVRLTIKADVSKNTTGFVELESATWLSQTSDGYTWGEWGALNMKPPAGLNLRQAWIQHKGSGLLGIPAMIRVGHQLLALGEKQFLDHTKFGDDAILLILEPTKEFTIGLVTAKFLEGSRWNSSANDTDGYVALATYKLTPAHTIGVHYTAVVVQAVDEFALQNLGIHANGKVDRLSYNAEYNTQFGDASATTEFDGYGLLLGAAYKFDPVNLRAEFARGSGDDNLGDNKFEEFFTTLGNDPHYSFIYEFTTRTASVSGGRATGIANTTYYRLGADFTPVKDLNASIDGFILRATKAIAPGQSKNIGKEINVKLSYKIDKNLTYFITAGIFNPDDFWTTGTGPGFPLVPPGQDKNITQAVHGVVLSF